MEVCFFLYNFVMKDTHVRKRFFFFSRLGYLMNVARNGLIMLLKPMEMYLLVWCLSPLFRGCLCYNEIIS